MKALLFHKFRNICIKTRNTNCFTIFVHRNFRRKAIQTVSIILSHGRVVKFQCVTVTISNFGNWISKLQLICLYSPYFSSGKTTSWSGSRASTEAWSSSTCPVTTSGGQTSYYIISRLTPSSKLFKNSIENSIQVSINITLKKSS